MKKFLVKHKNTGHEQIAYAKSKSCLAYLYGWTQGNYKITQIQDCTIQNVCIEN